MWELVSDLRDMGESNAILGRRATVNRDVLLAAESIYRGELLRGRVNLPWSKHRVNMSLMYLIRYVWEG